MTRRARRAATSGVVVVALLLTVVTALGSRASASSLGTFTDVVLEGAALPVEACQADGALYDSSGSLISLGSVLSILTTIEGVELTGVDARCLEHVVPTVIVIGDDNVLDGPDDKILAEIPLSLLETSPATYDVLSLGLTLPIGSSVSEVRVALTPV